MKIPNSSYIALALAFLSCTSKPKSALLVAGATTALPVLREISQKFKAKYPEAVLTVEGGGSSAAIVALRHKAVDIAAISRDLGKDEENTETMSHPFAVDALYILVHKNNPIKDISISDIGNILTGRSQSWKPFIERDGPILAIVESHQNNRDRHIDDLVLKGDPLGPATKTVASSEDLISIVSNNPDAIGITTLSSEPTQVKAIAVNGIMPSRSSILSGLYPLTRIFFLVTSRSLSTIGSSFLDFLDSNEARMITEKYGMFSVSR